MNKPEVVITHHALSRKEHTVQDVNQWHRQRWPNFASKSGWHVGYHYVIDWDGTTTQTREHDEEGAHTLGMNTRSIGVCFMGNNDLHYPSSEQIEAWDELYKKLYKEFPKATYAPHRRYASYKSCHGRLLVDDYWHRKGLLSLIQELRRLLAKLLSLTGKSK